MKKSQIVAQLYTVREHTKTPKDIAASLKRVRQIGYEAVQASGVGPVDDGELKKMLDGEGLACVATHESSESIIERPREVSERIARLGCSMTAFPSPGKYPIGTREEVEQLARGLDAAGAVFRAAGQVLGYHNHANEFAKVEGKTVLEMIYELTDPRNLVGEIDTYWVQAGGGDPVAWARKLSKRLPFIHIKDYGYVAGKGPVFEEIGSGNLDWKTIVAAAERSGCKWFIVEQDRDWANDDPFLSLTMSYDYLAQSICK
jgi:sugar phosphate isomerase/epimerase